MGICLWTDCQPGRLQKRVNHPLLPSIRPFRIRFGGWVRWWILFLNHGVSFDGLDLFLVDLVLEGDGGGKSPVNPGNGRNKGLGLHVKVYCWWKDYNKMIGNDKRENDKMDRVRVSIWVRLKTLYNGLIMIISIYFFCVLTAIYVNFPVLLFALRKHHSSHRLLLQQIVLKQVAIIF